VSCYIGQTENLNERLEEHEKEACAKTDMGPTHIHAHTNGSERLARRAEEKISSLSGSRHAMSSMYAEQSEFDFQGRRKAALLLT